MTGIAEAFVLIVRRELLLALRSRSDALMTLAFFVVVASLFPLAVGTDPKLLRSMAAGVVWVAALLASMLALGRLFSHDHADGTLEQLLLTPVPPSILVLAKTVGHWLVTGLPLVVMAPILGVQYGLGAEELGVLTASLLLGTPTVSLLGAVGAALTLGLRGGGVLVALLVLPLNIPVLIFGAGAVEAILSGLDATAQFSLLGAFLVAAVLGAPWVTAMALRISME